MSHIDNQLRGFSFTSGDEWQIVSFGQTPSGPDAADQSISIKGSIEIRFKNMNKRRSSPDTSADAKRVKTARDQESKNVIINLGGESDSELPTMDEATKAIRAKTLAKLQANLERYEQDKDDDDQMADHMFALLPRVIEQYNEHSYKDLQAFLSRDGEADNSHLPLDLYWNHIKVLARSGGWISDSIVDVLLSTTPSPSGNMDFISPGNKFYQQFLGRAGSKEMLEEALASETLPLSGPSLKNTDAMVGIWNPTNTHWVMFVASAAGEERSITLYDSCSRHSSTWKKTNMLPLVMELMGRFHPEFQGEWPEVIQERKTIRQKADDCGPFSIYGARCILAGKKIEVHKKSKAFGRHLRTKYVGEIRALIEGDPFDQYDRFADAIWDAHRDIAGDGSSGDDSSSSDDTDGDVPGEDRGNGAISATGPDAGSSDPDNDGMSTAKGTAARLRVFQKDDEDDIALQALLKNATYRDRVASILGSIELSWPELAEIHRVRSQTIERYLDASTNTVRSHNTSLRSGIHGTVNWSLLFNKRKEANVQYYSRNSQNTVYTPDSDTAGMFATPQHVKVDADDIGRGYDLVVVFTRQSGPTKSAIEQGLDKHTLRANEIYSAWHSIFNCFNDEHELVHHEDQISGAGNVRIDVNLHIGSSNAPLLGGDPTARRPELRRMKSILRVVAKVCKPKVLLLQAGLDASTTDTDSFRALINHTGFKDIQFFLTMVVPKFISTRYPQVFFSRYGDTAWGHWDMRKLVDVIRLGASTQLAQEPSHARIILWLDRIFDRKQQIQNGTRDTTFSHAMHMTNHKKRNGFLIAFADEKACEQCNEPDTPEYWTRGTTSPSAVRCSREDCLHGQIADNIVVSRPPTTTNGASTKGEDKDSVDEFKPHSSIPNEDDNSHRPAKEANATGTPRRQALNGPYPAVNTANYNPPADRTDYECQSSGCTEASRWHGAGTSKYFPELSNNPGYVCNKCRDKAVIAYNKKGLAGRSCHDCGATKSCRWAKSLPNSTEVSQPVSGQYWCSRCKYRAHKKLPRLRRVEKENNAEKGKKGKKFEKEEEEEDTD